MGMSSREPPATPDAPHAPSAAMTDRMIATGSWTLMPRVCTAASVMTVIVTAAPAILMVAPRGMDTE